MSAALAQPRRVLVVEDEPSIRDLLASALQAEGYEVTTANNGLAALALLDGTLPHLIVLDLMMPVMDGFAFRPRQLLDLRLAGIPVIVLSAEDEVHRVVPLLRPYACFSKPFDLDLVLATLAAVFGVGT